MLELVVDVLSWILLAVGGGFVLIGTIGVLRLPDVFTRLHAVGVTDTLGAGMILAGLALQALMAGSVIVAVKLGMIFLFLAFTGPLSSHALARAALADGLKPRTVDDDEPEAGK